MTSHALLDRLRRGNWVRRLVILLLCLSSFGEARQFRKIAPIPSAPEVVETQAPSGGQIGGAASVDVDQSVVETLTPVALSTVQSGVSDIVASWNTQGLDRYLDQYFPDRFQLLGTLQRDVPVDASLVLLSVQNVSTLNQVWGIHSGPARTRISTVVATVSLSVRFVDPFKGMIQLPHTSQFYLRVVESE
jgi:hypothetical protein